jgi:hypothetical protein
MAQRCPSTLESPESLDLRQSLLSGGEHEGIDRAPNTGVFHFVFDWIGLAISRSYRLVADSTNRIESSIRIFPMFGTDAFVAHCATPCDPEKKTPPRGLEIIPAVQPNPAGVYRRR